MAFYKANKHSKDPIRQNKGPKRTENSKPSNCRKKPDRGSNYNMHSKEDKKAFKNVETKPKSNPNPKLESFTYIIRNFNLDDNKSNCSISSLNSRNSAEDSKTEDSY